MKKFLVVMATLMGIFLLAGCGEKKSNTVSMPSDVSEMKGTNYKTVVAQLKDAGFVNVKTIKDPDLIAGFLHKDGDVETVSVDGKTDFSEDDEFSKKAKIKVTYHTFEKTDKNSSSSETSSESSSNASSSSTPAASSSSSTAAASSSEKYSYALTSRREKGEIFLTGSTTLIAHNGEVAVVQVGDGGIHPGTYKLSWSPGILHGSDPDYAYGFVSVNGDIGNGYGLNAGDTETITLNAGDEVTFKFFGQGDSDRIRLEQ